mmetsp:Transcript_92144/g.263329  ORF Transcript_92144/g.263329 Transcript_92144/m.263329 type:complete len:327 (+) Transcript_92144:540-1520(+)
MSTPVTRGRLFTVGCDEGLRLRDAVGRDSVARRRLGAAKVLDAVARGREDGLGPRLNGVGLVDRVVHGDVVDLNPERRARVGGLRDLLRLVGVLDALVAVHALLEGLEGRGSDVLRGALRSDTLNGALARVRDRVEARDGHVVVSARLGVGARLASRGRFLGGVVRKASLHGVHASGERPPLGLLHSVLRAELVTVHVDEVVSVLGERGARHEVVDLHIDGSEHVLVLQHDLVEGEGMPPAVRSHGVHVRVKGRLGARLCVRELGRRLGERSRRATGGDHSGGGGDREEADNGLAEAVVGDTGGLIDVDFNLLVRHGGGRGAQLRV